MDEQAFIKLSDYELKHLEDELESVDPDECEISTSGGVLSLTVKDGSRLVVNTQRAAREIWLAAQTSERRAWHFKWDEATRRWRTAEAELRETVARLLGERLGRIVEIN